MFFIPVTIILFTVLTYIQFAHRFYLSVGATRYANGNQIPLLRIDAIFRSRFLI